MTGRGSPWDSDWYGWMYPRSKPEGFPDDGSTQWSTWAGSQQITALPVGAGAGPPPPQELCRIECPSPRAIVVSVFAEFSVAGQSVRFNVRVGVGRQTIVLPMAKQTGDPASVVIVPGRIVIVDVEQTGGAMPPAITCTAALSPLIPWF